MKLSKQMIETINTWTTVTEVILPNMKRYACAKIHLLITDGRKGERVAFKLERELQPDEKITSVVDTRVRENLIDALSKEMNRPLNFYIFSTVGNRIVHKLKEVKKMQKNTTQFERVTNEKDTRNTSAKDSGDGQTQRGNG